MASGDFERAKAVLTDALNLSAAERPAYLDRACHGDPELRAEVESLLSHEIDTPSLLDTGGLVGGAVFDVLGRLGVGDDAPAAPQTPGRTIGPYELIEVLGEGGMGSVYRARQTAPIARDVALKIIKRGMDTSRVVARFEAERQTLARLDHPNIARILDAGADERGRPYFVMELVRGVPITEYADAHHLSVADRLRLFLPVCQAVQYAHQKGVLHRDLKPSNILVSEHDGVAALKVIDFGVAKAIESADGESLLTEVGQLVGTPEYMSPEQAENTGLDIDTRTDVYALGVILYELLTGSLPFDSKTLRSKGLEELRRTIREVDPQRPSQRVSVLASAPDAAQTLREEAPRVVSRLRGDLD